MSNPNQPQPVGHSLFCANQCVMQLRWPPCPHRPQYLVRVKVRVRVRVRVRVKVRVRVRVRVGVGVRVS